MQGITSSLAKRFDEKYICETTEFISKRFAVLSFLDTCFYSIAFCLLLISPVNASPSHVKETNQASKNADIPIYAAHVTETLSTYCQSKSVSSCKLNALSQVELLSSLFTTDNTSQITKTLERSEYELLIGSAIVETNKDSSLSQKLVFEISSQWRGITIDDVELSVDIAGTENAGITTASNTLMAQWIESALSKGIFDAEYLHQFLGASDYKNELKVPKQIGDFALSRQHLFSDPMKGMLSRYIHKDFELAVFDVYVYPLKTNGSLESQTQKELLHEQNDIQMMSRALGEGALTMTDIYEIGDIEGVEDIRVFAFEASLQTKSEPLFATQYAYVKNDKVVKFSINVPARITDKLIGQAINSIVVPKESSLMKQVRHVEGQSGSNIVTTVAP
jgi:hypothetical protein